jgi:biopolymer transport protein ExbB
LLALPAASQTPSTPDELLQQIDRERAAAQVAHDEAVREFEGMSPAQKRSALTEVFGRRDALTASSNALAAEYTANETRILEMNRALNAKATELELAEVFGLSREVAGDVASILQQSLITSQFPPAEGEPRRDDALRAFAASRATPVTDDIENLWFEIQREITASGQVARFQAPVVQPNGVATDSTVVRIGPFTALSDGRFVQYLPELGSLAVLPPKGLNEFLGIASRFERATEGYVDAVVDPFRGVTLGLYVQRPSIIERIEAGELVGYVILAVGGLGALAFIYQLLHLISVRGAVARQLKNLDKPRKDNPLGRVLLAFRGDPNRIEEDADIAELRIAEAVLHETPKLERFQPFLRLCVAAGPLLGLIGTVVGMIITFQSITESGQSDPRLMATGIGQAMIATVLGLGIAIPLLFANAWLNSLSRGIIQLLDEQSAGMLAESLEKRRGV